jgi:hypothetical protein
MRAGSRAAVALVLAAAVPLGACGGDSARDEVNAYIREANAVQERAAPGLRRADDAYRAFSAGKLDDARSLLETRRADRTLREARADLARLEPPRKAAELHRRLLRVFDMNLGFARETTALAEYVPAAAEVVGPLRTITARLQRQLRRAEQPAAQSEALARYRRSVNRQLTRLRRLNPPPILKATDEDQKDRLQAAGELADRLRRAVVARDSQRVARLLLRFRRLGEGVRDGLEPRALEAYNRRYRRISDATIALGRERERLADELG